LNHLPSAVQERFLDLPFEAEDLFGLVRPHLESSVWFDGRGEFGQGWNCGQMLGVSCRRWTRAATAVGWLDRIDRRVRHRVRRGGSDSTGVAVLLPYEALDEAQGAPGVVVIEIDASLKPVSNGQFLLSQRAGNANEVELQIERWCRSTPSAPAAPATVAGRATTSLPRERYIAAVRQLKRYITAGEIYQANLCQRFRVPVQGDRFSTYRRLAATTPAPRSAFVQTPEFVVASLSPEIFLRVEPPDRIETWPIKGTRARVSDPRSDRAAAEALLNSPKDRAELLMIIDLERNDLGRICRTGSVRVEPATRLQSFPAVHHLVARVEGRLNEGVGPAEMIRATFPGGSISGAPKIRARQLLAGIEPVRRGFFTGSLLWFGDDGSLDSSILIRTVVFSGGAAYVGAGGGIVADSDPLAEWEESNVKARAATRVLGFDPTEAT
jgi:anthranilate/para-aminobenzoate synthase component I